uniref:Uncharacterized protein n=2 Tax=Aureoumbra lagunensis TaxID=44058 RepID=A0A7S3JQI7_9STRA
MATAAQKYVKEHGVAPAKDTALPEVTIENPVKMLAHWDGRGKLASYDELEPNFTQKYRLYGEECVVVGCKRKIDTPKYIMELIGAPTCMQCAQRIGLQQTKGKPTTGVYEPEFEKPSNEDIQKAIASGISMPGWTSTQNV